MTQAAITIQAGGIDAYRALVIAKALEVYAKHHIQVNRAYTPKAMMDTARSILPKSVSAKLGRRDYLATAAALRALIQQN